MPNATMPSFDIKRLKTNGEDSGEVLRVEVSEFKSRKTLNVRIWYTDKEGELKPTPKGCNIPVEQVDQFLLAIGQCVDFLKQVNPEAN